MTRLFETLYPPRPYEQAPLGKRWCLEGHPGYGEELLCAAYPRNGDEGCDVRVYRTAMPAVFYRIQAGDLSLNTGSSLHQLAAAMAEALSSGMLGLSRMIPLPE